MTNRAAILKQKFTRSIGLPFSDILPAEKIDSVLSELGLSYRQTLYTPVVTLWMWLSQALESDHSLRYAVSRVLAWLAQTGAKLPSPDTGGYSKARQRLPEIFLERLRRESGKELEQQVTQEQLWYSFILIFSP